MMSHEEDSNSTSDLLTICGGLAILAVYIGFHIYDNLMRAKMTSAKVALELQVSELQAQLENQLELYKKQGGALKGSRKQLNGSRKQLLRANARVEELEGRLVVVEEEKAGAEAEAQGAEDNLKTALVEKFRVEEELAAKASKASGLVEKVAALGEELQKTREDARASWEGRGVSWP